MHKYEVVGRPLTVNGKRHKPGKRVEFSDADAKILVERGRLKPASAKAKEALEQEASVDGPSKPTEPVKE